MFTSQLEKVMAQVQPKVKSEFDVMLEKAMQQPGIGEILSTLNIARSASVVLTQLNPISNFRYTISSSASQQKSITVSK